MSISLLVTVALSACTPSSSEPEWPVEVFWIEPPPEDPDGFSIDNKCELSSSGKLPPELKAAVDHAYKFCRNGPPLKALAALDALDATLVRFPKFGWRFDGELAWQRYRWHGKLAVLRNIPKLRPRDRCVGPVP